MVLGIALTYTGLDAIKLLFTTAVINGVLAPPLILIVLLLTSDPTVMGDKVNSRSLVGHGLDRLRRDGRGRARPRLRVVIDRVRHSVRRDT